MINKAGLPEQDTLVEAIASALPGYNMSSNEWLGVCITLRLLSRGERPQLLSEMGAIFIEDVARAADAMHCYLEDSTVYTGKEALERGLR